MEVYYDSVAARVPVVGAAGAPVDVDITYQRCAEAGLCYPPITKTASLLLPTALAGTGGGATNPTDAGSGANTLGQSNLSRGANAGASDTYGLPGPGTANVVPIVPELPGPEWTGAAPLELPEQDRVATALMSGNRWLVILSLFGAGLLLTFTPCVLPMVPNPDTARASCT